MNGNRMTIRNIEPATYQFLERRAEELSASGDKISVNQLIGMILNQHVKSKILRDELTEIEKVNQRMDSLTEAVTDMMLTFQELLENLID